MANSIDSLDPAWAWRHFEPSPKQRWDHAAAAHLFRRAGFGANWTQLDKAVQIGVEPTLDALFKPLFDSKGSQDASETVKKEGDLSTRGLDAKSQETQVSNAFNTQMKTMAMTMASSGLAQQLSSWWLFRMLHTPDQLLEKTTLFWHGHFATSAAKVDNARLMLQQNELLRKHALGRFEPLMQAMSRDAAMLIWLDAASNRKVRPNENYARELMELFCLGVGNYTEQDIKQVARMFTGWEVVRSRFRFNQYQHDTGIKSIFGKRGNFGGEDAVRLVLAQPAASRFIVRKLVRYFVSEEPVLSDQLIEPLVKQLRASEFDIGKLVRTMLSSQLFFSDHVRGRIVRSPVGLGIGLLRNLEAHGNINKMAQGLQQLGQAVFYPPNVKGWEGGRIWINSSTLLGRANLTRQILVDGETKFAGGKLDKLLAKYNVAGPADTVDWLLQLFVAVPVPGEVRRELVKVAGGNGKVGADQSARIADTIHTITTLPEFQLV